MQRKIVEARVTAAWPKLDVLTAAELTEVGISERLRMEAVRWSVLVRIRRVPMYSDRSGDKVRVNNRISCGFVHTF